MARQILVPEFGIYHEDGEEEFLAPGAGVFNERQPAAVGGFKAYWALQQSGIIGGR